MTAKGAIRILKKYWKDTLKSDGKLAYALNMAIESIKKDIPVQPVEKRENKYSYYQYLARCPTCKNIIYNADDPYEKRYYRYPIRRCQWCGQLFTEQSPYHMNEWLEK